MDRDNERMRERAERWRMVASLVTDDALAARLRRAGEALLERARRDRERALRRERGRGPPRPAR